MKSYIATFDSKTPNFYRNTLENMWFSGYNRKDAEASARSYARHNGLKFISIRLVK